MADIPKRDITGECEGECEDRVSKMEQDQQQKIDAQSMGLMRGLESSRR